MQHLLAAVCKNTAKKWHSSTDDTYIYFIGGIYNWLVLIAVLFSISLDKSESNVTET